MAKATKTWKIGEYSTNGIITVTVNKNIVTVINKEWDYSAGCSRKSNQSNARVLDEHEFDCSFSSAKREISNRLHSYTTSYWADIIEKWIRTKVTIPKESWFGW